MIVKIIFTLLIGFLGNRCLRFWQNVQRAKASGIPYVVIPVYAYSTWTSIIFARTILRTINKIWPVIPNGSWRQLTSGGWPFKHGYAPFAALGTDSFLTIAPGGIVFQTADADVIQQIVSRGTDFPKATHLYQSINVYGKNVVSSEGESWRRHRKLLSPAFSEKNNQLVWKETLDQTQAMIASWLGPDGECRTIRRVADDTMRLSLNVICRAGFGQKMEWPKDGVFSNTNVPPNHSMSFAYSLHYVILHILYIMAVPVWLLKLLPNRASRKTYEAYFEWHKYMIEMIAMKQRDVQSDTTEAATIDLIGQLVKGQKQIQNGLALTDQEVMGNLFAMVIAGHETSANSIHFSLLLLALNPDVQRKTQLDLETVLQGRPISKWDYEQDLPRLLNGMLGAVMNEQLRLISPVINIPKIVQGGPQSLHLNGKQVSLPDRTMIKLCVPPVHRNPTFWPHSITESQDSTPKPQRLQNDLNQFKPDRWIRPKDNTTTSSKAPTLSSTESISSTRSLPDASDFLFTPAKGAFLAFSDGQRACLGKRFAQIEILAALAVILSQYTAELAVDEWASDEEVASMSVEQKRSVWQKAEAKANWALKNKMTPVITLQLRGAHVPIRLARRGQERFVDM